MCKRKILAAFFSAIASLLVSGQIQADLPGSTVCANGNENTAIVATTPTADFIDNGDGTVTHEKTGLMWQRCSLGQSWDGTGCSNKASRFTSWQQTLRQAAQNDFAGRSDWRLPNRNELASIIEYRCWMPAINSQHFPNTPAGKYWSSSPVSPSRFSVWWYVDFHSGIVSTGSASWLDDELSDELDIDIYYSIDHVRLVRNIE